MKCHKVMQQRFCVTLSKRQSHFIISFFKSQAKLFHAFERPVIIPSRLKMKNTIMSADTIVEPTGVEKIIALRIPMTAAVTDITAEHTITALKLLKSLIAESAGKIISADISSEPTRFIARTIINAVIIAISRLYVFE